MNATVDFKEDEPIVYIAREVRAGRRPPADFDAAFAQATIYAQRTPSRPGVMVAELPGKGRWVLVFSTAARLARCAGDCAWLSTTGADLLEQLPTGLGVLLDITDAVAVIAYGEHVADVVPSGQLERLRETPPTTTSTPSPSSPWTTAAMPTGDRGLPNPPRTSNPPRGGPRKGRHGMNRLPTGRLFRTGTGSDLVLTRTFRAPAEDVWAGLTDPERTARWFGPWEGDAAPGRTIKVQMAFEDQAPWCELHIEECEPPQRLAVSMADDAGTWRMELLLSEVNGSTELRLVHHLDTEDGIGEIGPGWEYYLDMLVAARDDSPKPDFDDYYPAMKSYFADLSMSD